MSTTAAPPSSKTTVCASCGADEPWGFASWCPRCGYYPKLNVNVAAPTIPKQTTDDPANLVKSIPIWGWILGAGIFAILGISLWARLTIDPDNSLRLNWSITQIAIGGILLALVQGDAYLFASSLSDKWSVFDGLMKPLAVWGPTIGELPKRSSRICIASWALVAVLAGLFVVDGIPFGSMFGDQPKKKKKFNLVHSVSGMASAGGEPEGDLEESMKDFAGKADQTDGAAKPGDGEGKGDGEEEEEEKKDEKKDSKNDEPKPVADVKAGLAECVIFGYLPDGEDDIGMLLLAAMVKPEPKAKERLKFVSSVTAESLPAATRKELAERLKTLRTKTPALKIAMAATWVRLEVKVKVRHQGLTRDKRFKAAEFVEVINPLVPVQAAK